MRDPAPTQDPEYARRLLRLQTAGWKRLLRVQAPYHWNLRRLEPGRCLEIGCGIGRNLQALSPDSVGLDHNELAIEIARERGFQAFLPDDFKGRTASDLRGFDSLLLSHLVEHMTTDANIALIEEYLPWLKETGKIIIIAPQERGFASDATHVEYMDFDKIRRLVEAVGFEVVQAFSFPFPRFAGRIFIYNEFVTVSRPRPA